MNLIAAVDQNWAIGKDGDQLCYIPADLKRFKALTTGHAVILGRRTLATFPGGRPLPGRRNLVLSRDPAFRPEGAELALRFGERYELYLCADGRAAFYDGYAPGDIRLWSYYSLPAEAVTNLVSTLPERAVSTQEPYGTFTY